MPAKILTADIDQFEVVTEITCNGCGMCSINLISLNDFPFIPAEFFELDIKYWFIESLIGQNLLENLLKIPWSRRNKFVGSYGMEGLDAKIISDYLSNETGPGSTYYRYL